MKTTRARRAEPLVLGRCTSCGVGLRHELLVVEAHLLDRTWVLCPACVPALLARFRQAHDDAGIVLDHLWNLPARDEEPGAW
jgi:hypothetical protein